MKYEKHKTIEITVELIDYRPENNGYIALLDGEEILVDPYTGEVWENERQELGKFTFKGFFGTSGVFLVEEEIKRW